MCHHVHETPFRIFGVLWPDVKWRLASPPSQAHSGPMFQARTQNPALAASLIGIATAFIAATTLFAKALGSDSFGPALHPLQISNGRYIFAFIGLATVAAVMRPKFDAPHWPLHIIRTTCGWAGVTLMFASVAYIPLADATAISFLNPVFAMMLAIPLLGERVGPIRWSAAIIALIGAFILLRPTPASFQIAALLPLGAAICLGFELIFIKKLSGRQNPFQVLLINNLIGVIISTVAVLPFWIAPTPAQWGLLALIGVFMAVAQACFVNAMARADASFVAPFGYGTLIFATLYDLIFYDVFPDFITCLGAGIILAGAVLLALREAQLRRL
jgi:drug/metabolite transporter (DMT)-like permease